MRKKERFTVGCLVLFFWASSCIGVSQSNPIGSWPLDDGAGTIARNLSDANHPGTVSGATWTSEGLSFDGLDDALTIQGLPATGGPVTFSCWINFSEQPYRMPILMRWQDGKASDSYSFGLTIGSSHQLCGMKRWNGTGNNIDDPNAMPMGWAHVALACDAAGTANGLRLYRDGRLVAQANRDVNPICSGMLSVGSVGGIGTTGYYFPLKAIVKDVRLYDRALVAAEIDTLAHPVPAIPAWVDRDQIQGRLLFAVEVQAGLGAWFCGHVAEPDGEQVGLELLSTEPATLTYDVPGYNLSWWPTESDVGVHYLVLKAQELPGMEGELLFDVATYAIRVTAVDQPPQIIHEQFRLLSR